MWFGGFAYSLSEQDDYYHPLTLESLFRKHPAAASESHVLASCANESDDLELRLILTTAT